MKYPERLFEPNIIHDPAQWMGIWTPQGWRVHKKRWGRANRVTVHLSGDGRTTFFPGALRDPSSGRVAWSDDLHVQDDSFTDGGIYPCDPRVEYPAGRPRWAVSHTLLCYPYADHGLYTHEYEWDLVHGHLHTRFRTHIPLEQAATDAATGRSVLVANKPLSTTIEGNVQYPLLNSAVRGVWDNPERTGRNYYTQRTVQLLSMHNAVYVTTPRTPVVQCHGLYLTDTQDPLTRVFDPETGECGDLDYLAAAMHVPLDEPRLGMIRVSGRPAWNRSFGRTIQVPAETTGTIDARDLYELERRIGARFCFGQVGYAANSYFDGDVGAEGFVPAYDFNRNFEIDGDDASFLRSHLGRRVRYNLYLDAYFGGDWLSTYYCVNAEQRPGTPIIADYEFGGGYDPQAGVVHLLDTPGPDRPVWVEYHYDAPAAPGENNIVLHLYREIDNGPRAAGTSS